MFWITISVNRCWVNDVHVRGFDDYDVLFLPEVLSNRLQTLALCSLGIEVYCSDYFKNSQFFFRIFSGFSGSLCMDRCRFNGVHVG